MSEWAPIEVKNIFLSKGLKDALFMLGDRRQYSRFWIIEQ